MPQLFTVTVCYSEDQTAIKLFTKRYIGSGWTKNVSGMLVDNRNICEVGLPSRG
jgi:hypothetical protein